MLNRAVSEDFRIVCPFVMLNTLNVYSHMFQTAQARVAEAMDGVFSFLQKQENKA